MGRSSHLGSQYHLAEQLPLINKRVYKPPFSHEEAVAIIAAGRGTQFDPEVLDAFIDIEGVFRSIAARFPA